MKNLTSQTLIIQRDNNTCVRLIPEPNKPCVVYKEANFRGWLNGIEVYAPSTNRVDFTNVPLDRNEAPFIVSREVFDALPDSAIEFVTPDLLTMRRSRNLFSQELVITRLISKTDVDVIPFVNS